jgi:transposase-like protein
VDERERDKNAARRLAILRHAEEVTGNVALTCRYYGITRQAFYLWRRRYETGGLDALRDRSRRPPPATAGSRSSKAATSNPCCRNTSAKTCSSACRTFPQAGSEKTSCDVAVELSGRSDAFDSRLETRTRARPLGRAGWDGR